MPLPQQLAVKILFYEMSNYFNQIHFISNSDLGALQRRMNLLDPLLEGKYLDFGNLVDARFTEEDVWQQAEKTEDEAQKIEMMYEAGMQDGSLRLYMQKARKQWEIYRKAQAIEWESETVQIPARCKFDFYYPELCSGADLKSTICKSDKDWIRTCLHFNYHRAAAWYMDLGKIDSFMIIGIGKEPKKYSKAHSVFKFAIRRGDPYYEAGRRQYSFLAFYYYFLIHQLNFNEKDYTY